MLNETVRKVLRFILFLYAILGLIPVFFFDYRFPTIVIWFLVIVAIIVAIDAQKMKKNLMTKFFFINKTKPIPALKSVILLIFKLWWIT